MCQLSQLTGVIANKVTSLNVLGYQQEFSPSLFPQKCKFFCRCFRWIFAVEESVAAAKWCAISGSVRNEFVPASKKFDMESSFYLL